MEYATLIGSLGFPIVITMYLLVKFEKNIKDNTRVIQELIVFLKTKR